MTYKNEWTCLWILLLFHQCVIISGDDKSLPLKSSSDFWATRGRRGDENIQSPEDLIFWANRGKRLNYNLPRPNGFLFPTSLGGSRSGSMSNILDKRKFFNLPRPNGFMFPSSSAMSKRTPELSENDLENDAFLLSTPLDHDLLKKNYHIPKPNNFFFLSKNDAPGKRNYNLPSPNGFLFPSKQGKRAGQAWNLATPNGFLFPSSTRVLNKDKREQILADQIARLYQKRGEEMTGDIFFAGRGKRGEVEMDTFFAGRGRRSEDSQSDEEEKIDSFWALRGKKSNAV
eukprot:TRINITY_DN23114_c0_g1_i1.p1 TRINITY_DN23114_c0_g1~~TRINITY_DN23114_c0_g1_i1.p1  ORF type:complete len:299 (+),score=85.21 TRINITY_DN23114_c0_g1_i1:41-898(+)